MTIKIVDGYGEVFEKTWKDPESFKAEDQLAVIADYLHQYKCDLQVRMATETNETKREIMLAKVNDISEILKDHAEMFTFIHYCANAL